MSDNPYAPPGADLEHSFEGGGGGSFEIGLCASDAWSATWANFPLWLGVGFVALLAGALAAVTIIGLFLILPVLLWGSVLFALRMHDGNAEFADLFSGFSRYAHALLTMGALVLLLLLIQAVGQSVQTVGTRAQSGVVMGVGAAINAVFALVVLPRLNFAYFFVVDAGAGPIEALSRAWTVTQGNVLKVVGLVLLNLLVVVLGALVLIVGVIPAAVMAYLMWVSAYRQMVGTRPRVGPRASP